MKRKPPAISPEDAELFREAIGEVRRIETEAAATARPGPKPEPRRLKMDEAEALRESRDLTGNLSVLDLAEVQSYRRPEVSENTLKRLGRGQFSVQDEIDLHHLRAADAEAMLRQFLNQSRIEGHLCVQVVHGKGLRSEGSPVLKMLVDRMLRQRGDVLAFASAPPSQGGTGAVLVLLSQR